MLDLLGSVGIFLTVDNFCIDNTIFRLHYKATVVVLLAASLLVTSKQYFGDPIECIFGENAFNRETVNSYCWIYPTYVVDQHFSDAANIKVAMPGIGPHNERVDKVTYQNYYQWVCLTLFVQALTFSVPGFLWKIWEGGRLRMIAADLGNPIDGNNWTPERRNAIVGYLADVRVHPHTCYILRFTICELLNFIIVVSQIFLLDTFLGGNFLQLGPDVVRYVTSSGNGNSTANAASPLDRLFPKMAKCSIRMYGKSGGLSYKDFLCVLPLNKINEKVFLFLWFWFVTLAVMSSLALLYRASVLLFRKVRTYQLWARAPLLTQDTVTLLGSSFPPGHWFLLMQLSKNVTPNIFLDLLTALASHFERKTAKFH